MGYATNMFSKRLKELREASGMTQGQLANELKVSRGAISYYEKGERTPDIEFLDSVSVYFDVPIDFALGFTSNLKTDHKNMYDYYGLTDEVCDMLSRFRYLGDLISIIFSHDDFHTLKNLYKGMLENHITFNYNQLGYISFLITDILKQIISDSLYTLLDMQLSQDERNSLLQHSEDKQKIFDELQQQIDEQKKKLNEMHKFYIERDTSLSKEYDATRFAAIDAVYSKFESIISAAEESTSRY